MTSKSCLSFELILKSLRYQFTTNINCKLFINEIIKFLKIKYFIPTAN